MNRNALETIVKDPDGAKTLVEEAKTLGHELVQKKLGTSQIRALFGEVRQIQAQWNMGGDNAANARRRLILLKPKMAYRAKRERSKAVQQLVDVLDPAIDFVIAERDHDRQRENFGRFVEFFEAILAYHKAYGGN